MLRRASMQDLSAELAAAARTIATRVATIGHRAWIVGGAVRDLCLSRVPHEIDMASAATPAEIERLFEGTIPVGRAFGTVVIRVGGVDVQHTTFRSERGYSDARHPDQVGFGATVEEDASRRDFTCNALYLDPLDDTFLDPTHGQRDLEAGVLACVGDPGERFAEDGLRLLRMARFAAVLGLTPRRDVLAAARTCGEALRGVSAERILAEFQGMFAAPAAAVAMRILHEALLLEPCLSGFADRVPDAAARPAWLARRVALMGELPPAPGTALGLAALVGPDPAELRGRDALPRWRVGAVAIVERLRVSRALRHSTDDIWHVFEVLSTRPAELASRSGRVLLMRRGSFAEGLALARAWALLAGEPTRTLDALADERSRTSAGELHPAALIGSADLEALALPRGPAWAEILAEAERLQLDGKLTTRTDALAWLAARVRGGSETQGRSEAHDGGKIRRSPREKG